MSKKLLGEVEKAMRDVRLNLELYDEKWEELRTFNQNRVTEKCRLFDASRKETMRGKKHAVRTATLELMDYKHVNDAKAKIETDLEGMLRKLHRLRQQLIDWISNCSDKDLRNKEELMDYRKHIELRYKRGKVFYRQGISSEDCSNVQAEQLDQTQRWMNDYIQKLNEQVDTWQGEIEDLNRTRSSMEERERIEQLTAMVELHKMNIKKLEGLLRAIRNEKLMVDEPNLEKLRVELERYIEDNELLVVLVTEDVYIELGLNMESMNEWDVLEAEVAAVAPIVNGGFEENESRISIGERRLPEHTDKRVETEQEKGGLFPNHRKATEALCNGTKSAGDATRQLSNSQTSFTTNRTAEKGHRLKTSFGSSTNPFSTALDKTLHTSSIEPSTLQSTHSFPLEDLETQSVPVADRGEVAPVEKDRVTLDAILFHDTKSMDTTNHKLEESYQRFNWRQSSFVSLSSASSGIGEEGEPHLSCTAFPSVVETSQRTNTGQSFRKSSPSFNSEIDMNYQTPSNPSDPLDEMHTLEESLDHTTELPLNKLTAQSVYTFTNATEEEENTFDTPPRSVTQEYEEETDVHFVHTTQSSPTVSRGKSMDAQNPVGLVVVDKAICDWKANDRNQLSVTAGQKLYIVSRHNSGWTFGYLLMDGKKSHGWFPSTICRSVENRRKRTSSRHSDISSPAHSLYSKGMNGSSYREEPVSHSGIVTPTSTATIYPWDYTSSSFPYNSDIGYSLAFHDTYSPYPPLNHSPLFSLLNASSTVEASDLTNPSILLQVGAHWPLQNSESHTHSTSTTTDIQGHSASSDNATFNHLTDHKRVSGNRPVSIVHIAPDKVEVQEVRWDWNGELADDSGTMLLRFCKGEKVEILAHHKSGWIFGRIRGETHRRGWFPDYMLKDPDDLLERFGNKARSNLRVEHSY